jgi:hypothetical protein
MQVKEQVKAYDFSSLQHKTELSSVVILQKLAGECAFPSLGNESHES